MRADALVEVDCAEVSRRGLLGAAAVTSLPLLDALMNLPLGCPVPVKDLTDREHRLLTQAPVGCVSVKSGMVERLLRVPVTVVAALICAPRWSVAAPRCAAFAPFTQRVVLLPAVPRPDVLWRADYAGAGIWARTDVDRVEQVVAAEPLAGRRIKAAGWRFAEDAYRQLIRSEET